VIVAEEVTNGREPARPPWEIDDDFFFWLDLPQSWSTKDRWLTLAGWCLPKNGPPLQELRIIAGRRVYAVQHFMERPDVIKAFGAGPEKLLCGFCLPVKIPAGRTHLQIEASNQAGSFRLMLAKEIRGPIFSWPRFSRATQRLDNSPASDFVFWLDRPFAWENIGRKLFVCGWCVHPRLTINGIRARVGRKIFAGSYGIQRPDLRASFSKLAYAHCAGFALAITLPRGKSELLLEARDREGSWHILCRRSVSAQDKGEMRHRLFDAELFDPNRRDLPSRFAFWLEPRCDWSRLPQRQRIVGWCLPMHGAPIEAIRARVGRHQWLAKTGITRPEVRAAYPDLPGGLSSGFTLTIEPPLGRNLLFLEVLSNEKWEPFFAHRICRPLFWRRGENRFGASSHYEHWLRLYDQIDFHDRRAIRRHLKTFKSRPRFSVLIPCYNSGARDLRAAMKSVQTQLYTDWEICAVDDCSEQKHVWPLLQQMARRDPRVRIHRRSRRAHISAASNDALKMATGDFIVLLDHDDELAPLALYYGAHELNQQPDLQLLFADEDKMDENRRRFAPYFKPQWNPDLLLAQNYVIHPLIVRTDLARAVGGFDSRYDGAQDHDFVLRCSERIKETQVRHIPRILYHWRTVAGSTADLLGAKPYANAARKAAVEAHLGRRGITAHVSVEGDNQRIQYPPPNSLVSIIIPTRDRGGLLEKCLASIREKTSFNNYELVIVDNGTTEPAAHALLDQAAATERTRVLYSPGQFNYSELCNKGAAAANGEVLVFLNNDVEVMNSGWLTELVSQASRPEVGIVGARLWFADGRLQHAGIVLNPQRIGSYAYFRKTRSDPGYFSQLQLVRDVAAVTGACMGVRAEVLARLGGLNERELGIAFNDIDFCLRAWEAQLRVVWTPHAELIHHESSSRGLEDTVQKQSRFHNELAYMQERWGPILRDDPFYNPNLDLTDELYALAFPPRITPPWRTNSPHVEPVLTTRS
jgi:GT2 family glycosyltransferase